MYYYMQIFWVQKNSKADFWEILQKSWQSFFAKSLTRWQSFCERFCKNRRRGRAIAQRWSLFFFFLLWDGRAIAMALPLHKMAELLWEILQKSSASFSFVRDLQKALPLSGARWQKSSELLWGKKALPSSSRQTTAIVGSRSCASICFFQQIPEK